MAESELNYKMAFTHYNTKAFFIEEEAGKEADYFFTVFSREFGKLKVRGKSIRKVKSKLRSGAQTLYLSNIEFIQGKIYKTLTEAVLINKFRGIRRDLEKIKTTEKIAESLDSLTGLGEKDYLIWNLLEKTLKIVDSEEKREIIRYFFIWKLFSFLGYSPELYRCSVCGRKLLPEMFFFNPEKGGIVCWRCFKKDDISFEISVNAVKTLRILIKEEWPLIKKLALNREIFAGLERTTESYLAYLTFKS